MARATTGILVDLADTAAATAVADRLRRMGFRAAARDESTLRRPVPPPRHPAVVVTERERADEHAHDPQAADRRVLVVSAGDTGADGLLRIAEETARHADQASPALTPLETLTTAELAAGISPFRHAGGDTSFGAGKFAVVALAVYEGARIRRSFGAAASVELERALAGCVDDDLPGVHPIGVTEHHEIVLVLEGSKVGRLSRGLEVLVQRLAARRFVVAGVGGAVSVRQTTDDGTHDVLQVTPLVGYAPFSSKDPSRAVLARALVGVQGSRERLDLEPTAGPPRLAPAEERAALREPVEAPEPAPEVGAWRRARDAVRAAAQQPTGRLWAQLAATLAVGVLAPYVAYAAAAGAGIDLTGLTYPVVVAAMVVTALAIVVESTLAADPPQPAPIPADERYPSASAVVAAYLPNESATIVDTVEAFRRIDYPGDLQIVLAYNTPQDLPVEATLRDIARRDPRLTLLRVPASTSKAQNVNAALDVVRGDLVGIFDADHHPGPGSFERAWAWLRDGYDVVQGHCVVRNGSASHLAGVVAVEFESIYAVSHPGRAQLHGFGIFGGSNGYWRTEVLRATRMRRRMLTEDIDSSIRAIVGGHRVASDPRLTSYELATTTLGQLTAQRLRWAQGWLQVSLQHLGKALRSPHLTLRQKVGMTYLLGWREVYPWVSLQVYPILLFALLHPDEVGSTSWFVSLFVLSTVFTLAMGPLQAVMAYVLGEPSVRAHPRWYWRYLLWSGLFTELKSALTRVAHVKELSRERVWRVTPRVVPGPSAPAPSPVQNAPEAQVA